MGSSKSKLIVISYEDAEKRVDLEQLNRLKQAFNESAPKGILSFEKFHSDVFSYFLPISISESLFKSLKTTSSSAGITFKELLIGIVTLTKSSFDEKCKFLFNIYCNESGTGIDFSDLQYYSDKITNRDDVNSARRLLDESFVLSFDNFKKWISDYPRFNQMTQWLLTEENPIPQITTNHLTQDLYQILAGISHLNEFEIMELEKTYRRLVSSSSNTMVISRFSSLLYPYLPEEIIGDLFRTFDENQDGDIDLKELACGVSACSRGPEIERKKFCLKIFDTNKDGLLTTEDIERMQRVCSNLNSEAPWIVPQSANGDVLQSLLRNHGDIAIDDVLIFVNKIRLLDSLLDCLTLITTVIFELRPESRKMEISLIANWLQKEENLKIFPHSHLCLISKLWLTEWMTSCDAVDKVGKREPSQLSVAKPRSNKEPLQIIQSRSLNSLFIKKHHYDLKRSTSSKVKQIDHTDGRYTLHTHINNDHDIMDNIYPDIPSQFTSFSESSNISTASTVQGQFITNGFTQSQLSPINNSNLIQNCNSKFPTNLQSFPDNAEMLNPGIKLGDDFEIIPESLWNCLHHWYTGGPIIKRPVWIENQNNDIPNLDVDEHCIIFHRRQHKIKLELHLLTLLIMRHILPTNSPQTIQKLDLQSIAMMGGSVLHSATSNAKELIVPKRQVEYRACFSRKMTILQLNEFLSCKLKVSGDEIRLWKVIDENTLVLLEDESKCLFEIGFQNYDKILVEKRNIDLSWPEELYQMAKSRTLQNRRSSCHKGVTGLSNIGNTCFFNSAIQCISNTAVLTDYFTRDLHLYEINRNNSLGCQGVLALRYAELIRDMWTGSTSLIVPLKLKMTLEKSAKQFIGHQQHDSQELLSALLDAMHEDLNRVDEKPDYKECKDSDGRDDTVVADEAWQSHLSSHQSIIVDLFHGLLKSVVCCNCCGNNSVKFDVYSILSLPIPMEFDQEMDIYVFQSQSAVPKKFNILLNLKETNYSEICEQLEKDFSLEKRDVLLALIEDDKIKKFVGPYDKIHIGNTVYAYLFDNPDKNSSKDIDKDADSTNLFDASSIKFVVYHRKQRRRSNYFLDPFKSFFETFGYPLVFIVTKKDVFSLTNKRIYETISRTLENDIQHFHYQNAETAEKPVDSTAIKPNHAVDCDLENQLRPFVLSRINSDAFTCSQCHWSKFCNGCELPFDDFEYKFSSNLTDAHYFSIDWSPAAMHLKCAFGDEKKCTVDAVYTEKKMKFHRPIDLISCLEHFIKEEALDKDALVQCTKCKKPQPAHKKLDLWTLPPFLIIHLKRFQYSNNRWQKSYKVVQYPVKNLDFDKFILQTSQGASPADCSSTGDKGRPIYNLYAVNCHLGNLQMGHYITYAKNKESGKWYLFNDSICKAVEEKDVVTNNAYLLFYERTDFPSDQYLDDIIRKNKKPVMDATEIISDDDDVESDIKKYCVVM